LAGIGFKEQGKRTDRDVRIWVIYGGRPNTVAAKVGVGLLLGSGDLTSLGWRSDNITAKSI
jgi:hypothetical protein